MKLASIFGVLSLLGVFNVASAAFDIAGAVSSDGTVHANDRLLGQIFQHPRNYAVMLLLTAEADRYNCKFCQILGPVVRNVAASYRKQNSGSESLYFVIADIEHCQGAYETLGLNSAPTIYLYGPDTESRKGLVAPHEQLDFSSTDQQDGHIAQWLSRKGYPVHIVKPFPWDKFIKVAVAVVGVLSGLYFFRDVVVAVFRSKQLWLALSLVAIILFISGHMFNVIRKTQLMGWNNGTPVYFENGFQIQYGIETQILAVVYAIISFATICLIVKVPKVPALVPQTALAVVLTGLVLVGFSQLISAFKKKYGGYPYELLPVDFF